MKRRRWVAAALVGLAVSCDRPAPPAPPPRTVRTEAPKPPQEKPPEAPAGEDAGALLDAGDWAGAESAFRSMGTERATAAADLCALWVRAHRRSPAGPPISEAIAEASAAVDRLSDSVDRDAWRARLAALKQALESRERIESAFKRVVSEWPAGDGWPSEDLAGSILVLRAAHDDPTGRRAIAWLEPRLDEVLGRAEEMLNGSRKAESRAGFEFLVAVDWTVERARAGIARIEEKPPAVEALQPKGPPKPKLEIPLDFVPADFAVADAVFAADRARGKVVVASLSNGAIENRIDVRGRPSMMKLVGATLWVGSADSDELAAVDVSRRAVAGRVKLPSAGVVSMDGTSTGRLYVTTSGHLVEIDSGRRAVLQSAALPDLRDRGTSAVTAAADGSIVYVHMFGYSDVWRPREGFAWGPEHRDLAFGVADPAGMFIFGPATVFDPYGRKVSVPPQSVTHVLVPAGRPVALYCNLYGNEATVRLLDLYRMKLGDPIDVRFDAIYGPARAPVPSIPTARLAPDASAIVFGQIQPPPPEDYEGGRSTLCVMDFPGGVPTTRLAIRASPPGTVYPAEPLRFGIRLDAPYDARAKVEIDLMPEGMTWNPETREFSWTPSLHQVGPHQIRLRAIDTAESLNVEHAYTFDVAIRHALPRRHGSEIRISSDARYLYAVSWHEESADVYDIETHRSYRWPFGIRDRSEGIADSGGRLYVIDAENGRIVSWKLPDGDGRQVHELRTREALRLFRVDGGGRVAYQCDHVTNRGTVHELRTVGSGDGALVAESALGYGIAFAPNGRVLAEPGFRTMAVYEKKGSTYHLVPDAAVDSGIPQFSGDGDYLVSGRKIYESAGWRLLREEEEDLVADPTGPFYGVRPNGTIEVRAFSNGEVVSRFPALDRSRLYGVSAVIPLSLYKRVLVRLDRGCLLLPDDFEPGD